MMTDWNACYLPVLLVSGGGGHSPPDGYLWAESREERACHQRCKFQILVCSSQMSAARRSNSWPEGQ